jgi:salicylate hydroxylase
MCGNANLCRFGDVITYNNSQRGGRNSVHRARFVEELAKLIPDEYVIFNTTLVDIIQEEDGVQVAFQDGTVASHSAVIACDGVKSVSRGLLLGKDHPNVAPVFSGEYAYRGLIPREAADSIFGHDMLGNGNMFCGKDAYILLYPVDGGKLINLITVHRKQDMKWDVDDWVVPVSKQMLLDDYQGWGSGVRQALEMIKEPSRWALFDVPNLPKFCARRVVLIGDAAHASTPNAGAGASMAFEDAYILSTLLSELGEVDRIEDVFRAFDAVRRPRTQRQVATAREVMEFSGLFHEEDGDDLEKLRENVRNRYWMWDIDLQGEVERARSIMRDYSICNVGIDDDGRAKSDENCPDCTLDS